MGHRWSGTFTFLDDLIVKTMRRAKSSKLEGFERGIRAECFARRLA
jgi:hypothetical protein